MENNFLKAAVDDSAAPTEMDDPNGSSMGPARPRRHDDEDEGSDILEDDDLESTVGGPANGDQKGQGHAEEEKELPAHACA